ncbi:MAG: class I SAM-dependent methyltransferase [Acidobacteriota bacterium]|nr:class I SAM-dependent methyltransferase [Acidobacteriota bacterium]
MKPTERFSYQVENYVRYRPSYPPQVIELMRREMNLSEKSTVADVGSGTGIFTKLLLETGCTVIGVEPNEAMRRAGEEFLKEFSNFKSVDGTSENTDLPDKSVDLIAAAQAFHWFDREKAKAEFQRIIKPGGYVALIWNDRQLASTAFLREYEKFLLEYGTDYKEVRHDAVSTDKIRTLFNEDFHETAFPNVQRVDFDGLKGRLLSASYIPRAGHPRFEEMLSNLADIFARHQQAGAVEILYDTKVFYGKF